MKAVRTTVPTPMAARTTVSTSKAAALTTVTSSTVTTPKAALVRVTTPNDARKVCAAVSIDSIENETVGNDEINNRGDNDVDHGYTRVTRKRSGRTKAVICDSAADLYNSDKWPAGVYLRKFFRQNV